MQHYKKQSTGYFVTLTYNTENVPIDENGRMTLSKKPLPTAKCKYPSDDLQQFFKRLRKNSTHGRKISYYAVGEYGTTNWRPHYHIILFNSEINDVLSAWRLGDIHFGEVTEASVGYCLKYISKPKRVPQYKGDTRLSERSYMSKNIGLEYLSPGVIDWHLTHGPSGIHCQVAGGKKISIPRYYRDRIPFTEDIREQSQATYILHKRKQECKIIARIGEELYIRNKQAAIDHAFKKMYKPDKSKKL